jgi:ATP phosphoribosyltransferase regulatory subunit HisZ
MEQAEVRGFVRQAVARAGQDAAFRRLFASDPAAALQRELGVALPEDADTERLRTMVQARFGTAAAGGELSDEQLEAVAGGLFCVQCI